MKKLKWLLVILGLLLALGIGFHRQLRNLWVNLTFPLTEHTETEWKVKEYADLHGVSYARESRRSAGTKPGNRGLCSELSFPAGLVRGYVRLFPG